MTKFLLLSDSFGFVDVGRSVGISFTIAAGLRQRRVPWDSQTIFYCLRLGTSLFVAFYDSQGYGGGILPRLHTGYSNIQSESESEPELLYDWRYTANNFVLAPSPLRLTARISFSQLNTYSNSPYITSSLTRGQFFADRIVNWMCLQGRLCSCQSPWKMLVAVRIRGNFWWFRCHGKLVLIS
jgi:hypothetical protein